MAKEKLYVENPTKHLLTKVVITAVLCCLSIPVSFALFISGSFVKNNFTVGENTSHIEETFGSYTSFEEGKSYEKRVAVKNDGNVPCYVRMFAEIEDPDVSAVISVDFNTADWTKKQADGYYYYKKALQAGDSTPPLFTTLKATDDVSDFQMICYSESVQAAGAQEPISAFDGL